MATVEAPVVARSLYDSLAQSLKQAGAEGQLDEVINAFIDLVREAGPRDAEVTSAITLSRQQQDATLQQLRGKYGAGLDVRFLVDPAILGGLIVRVGDKVLDDSVQTRLAAVQQRMLS